MTPFRNLLALLLLSIFCLPSLAAAGSFAGDRCVHVSGLAISPTSGSPLYDKDEKDEKKTEEEEEPDCE